MLCETEVESVSEAKMRVRKLERKGREGREGGGEKGRLREGVREREGKRE